MKAFELLSREHTYIRIESWKLYTLLRISFEPSPYGRVVTVTGYIWLLYRGTNVVEVPIAAYGEPLKEDHQDLPSDWTESDY